MSFFMAMLYAIIGFIVLWVIVAVVTIAKSNSDSKGKSPEQLRRELAKLNAERQESIYGAVNRNMLCPHCATTGHVHTKPIVQKKGVSGGKATAALFTGGVSMVATGLSRKESHTQAHCSNCNNTWVF